MGRVMAALGHADQGAAYFHKTITAIQELLAVNMPSGSLGQLAERGFRSATVVDIRTYDGQWTHSAKALFPAARFVMVDALPGKEEELRRVAETFPIGQAEVLMALLGAEQRQRGPFYAMETGFSVYEEQTTFPRQAIELPMTRLDKLVTALAAPALMNIDIQDAELDVLAGVGALIEAIEVPILECAIPGHNKGAPQLTEVLISLDKVRFLPYDIADLIRGLGGILFHFDTVFVRQGNPLRPEGMLW
jgi:FkbM family methyltransferase